MILLLAVVMAVSVVLTSGFALSLPESAALEGDDVRLQAIAPAGTTTVETSILGVTQVTGGNVNVHGKGGAVSLEGSGGTAYLYGQFGSLNSTPAVSIGAG